MVAGKKNWTDANTLKDIEHSLDLTNTKLKLLKDMHFMQPLDSLRKKKSPLRKRAQTFWGWCQFLANPSQYKIPVSRQMCREFLNRY
jgi:hypothetical protein